MVLDCVGERYGGVGNEGTILVVHEEVCVASAGGPVGAVADGTVIGWVADGRGGVLARGEEVAVGGEAEETLWFVGVALEGDLGDEGPFGGAGEGEEEGDGLDAVGEGMGEGERGGRGKDGEVWFVVGDV